MKIEIGGLSFITFFIFLILKLTSAIAWSWWWVTSPIWISALLALLACLLLLAFMYKNREIFKEIAKIKQKMAKSGKKGKKSESLAELMKQMREA